MTVIDPITEIAAANELRIGGGYFGAFGTGRYFHGSIDEVAIYDRALPQSRIQAHLQARNDATIRSSTRRPAR